MTYPVHRLSEICTFLSGGTPSVSNRDFWSGDICWVSPKDMRSDVIVDTEDHITASAIKGSATKLVPANTILVVARSGILVRRLPVSLTSKPMTFNQDIKAILVDEKCAMTKFVTYFLRSQEEEILNSGVKKGATVHSLASGYLENLRITLPPLDEQQRIVDILDRATSIQRLRQAADEKLKEIIPALFVDMFGDPATNPKGLPLVKLGALIDRIETGKNVTAGSGTSDYRILKVSAVTSGFYKESESKPAPDDHTIIKNHIVQQGDFLFSRANTVELVGATALVHETDGKTLLPDKLWRICWRKDISPRYMLAVMQNKDIRTELGRASSGTSASMRNISQGRLASIEVPLASFEQQLRFAKIAEALTAKAEMSQEASQHAQSTAAALTQSLLG